MFAVKSTEEYRLHQLRGRSRQLTRNGAFLVEDEMSTLGTVFSKANWVVHVVSSTVTMMGPRSGRPTRRQVGKGLVVRSTADNPNTRPLVRLNLFRPRGDAGRQVRSFFVKSQFWHRSVSSSNSLANRIGVIRVMTISLPHSGHADSNFSSGGNSWPTT